MRYDKNKMNNFKYMLTLQISYATHVVYVVWVHQEQVVEKSKSELRSWSCKSKVTYPIQKVDLQPSVDKYWQY